MTLRPVHTFLAVLAIAASSCKAPQSDYINAMENRLTPEEKEMLQRIYEPVVVASPLEDARTGICILPDGEIRSYGKVGQTKENRSGIDAYLSSTDCGLTWKLHYDTLSVMKSCTYIPEADIYLRTDSDKDGTYVLKSTVGPDDRNPRRIKVADKCLQDTFLPRKSAFSDRIWFSGQWRREDQRHVPVFFYSDDMGESFTCVELPVMPEFQVAYPHKGMRWDVCGTEPVVEELSEGKMMMIIRNSLDSFWCSFSEDGGTSWSDPEPSPFHGTATTAYLLRLRDGRTLSFWNNTRPLPELDHTQSRPALGQDIIDGFWEDVFTNRDANHVAITEDAGESWIGARELFLNVLRNRADYRYVGGVWSSNDKSVHQFQAYELPYGKILVSFGQNVAGRKLVIFDVNWIYETSRSEDFMLGLDNVSTHVYVNDICGSTSASAGNGHCAWNRTSGALMCPDPEGSWRDVVCLSHHHDARLLNDLQGLVWNFPASMKADVEAELYLNPGAKVRVSLMDCWYNPCDPYIGELAQFSTVLGNELVGGYHKLRLSLDGDTVKVFVDEKYVDDLRCNCPISIGISYLHVQCLEKEVYVRNPEKHAGS